MNRFDRLRVLLVDDSADMRALMRGILGGLGVRDVVDVADAEACFAAMRDAPPDLAFIDWLMEPVDGVAEYLARQIRDTGARLLVVRPQQPEAVVGGAAGPSAQLPEWWQ